MRQHISSTAARSFGGMVAALLYVGCFSNTQAADYRLGYPDRYFYPNAYYGLQNSFGLRRDMMRLDDQIQQQQWQLDEQTRQQQDQTRLIRQQQSTQQRVTAMQACYYRFNGGLDLCDRLFAKESEKHASCVEKVEELNSGCASDMSRPAPNSRD